MNKRLVALSLGTLTSLVLLVSSPISALVNMASMHDMMPKNQCQSSCSVQSPIANQATRNDINDKDVEPQPAEPFYISLVVFGSIATVIAIILKLHRAQWPPPNRLAMICLLRI